jgi:hypothetical protein
MDIDSKASSSAPVPAVQRLVDLDRRPTDRVPLVGPYTELVWGPLVGPTAVLLSRRLSLIRHGPATDTVDLRALAANLGVGGNDGAEVLGRHHRIVVALTRAEHYGLLEWKPEDATIGVTGWVPEVSPRLQRRLPDEALARHHQILGALSRTAGVNPAGAMSGPTRRSPLHLAAAEHTARPGPTVPVGMQR